MQRYERVDNGCKRDGRKQLEALMAILVDGYTVKMTEIDRLLLSIQID